jgi:iron complex outermembrane recepter protein
MNSFPGGLIETKGLQIPTNMKPLYLSFGRRIRHGVLAWILAPLLSTVVWSQGGDTGVVAGRVSNVATGANLEGATVRLEGTNISVTTERDGTYRLQAPSGAYTLKVSYTGLDEESIPVLVQTGGTVTHNALLTAGIYKLREFVVAGEREGNAMAITLQRQAMNVKNVVSADAFGTLAGNPADLLFRLPGVVGDSVGGDIRYVQIRGVNPNLSTITMDGNRLANAGSAGATRDFQFQTMGSDTIDRMEVIKSPTPDMEADSIGGAVNMVTKSAFSRMAGRQFTLSLGATTRPLDERDTIRPNFAVSYAEIFGKKRNIGISFNYGRRQIGSLIDFATSNFEVTDTNPAYRFNFGIQDFRISRTRWGGNFKIDYKLSQHSEFTVNIVQDNHYEQGNHASTTWSTNQVVATRDAAGNLTGTGGIIPGYTASTTEWRAVAASNVAIRASSQNKDAGTWTYRLGGSHKYDNTLIDYNGYLSDSTTIYPAVGGLQITARNVGMRIEMRDAPSWPSLTQISGPSMLDLNNYTENVFNISNSYGRDKLYGGQINAKRQFQWRLPTYLKTGLRYRQQQRNLQDTPRRLTLVGADGVMGINPATGINDDNLAQFRNNKYVSEGYQVRDKYPVMPYLTRAFRDKEGSLWLGKNPDWGYSPSNSIVDSPNLWVEDNVLALRSRLLGDRRFKEAVSAAYVMGNIDLGKLSILGGLRFEKTETAGTGSKFELTPAERARRAAWVGPVTETEALRRTLEENGTRITNRGNYDGIYPGLHFKYNPLKQLVFRLSWATNIGRPAISNLLPRLDVDHDLMRVTVNNPSLKPQAADNFDLSVEYYFEPAGLVSAGVFYKDIRDFIYTDSSQFIAVGASNGFDGEYGGYNLFTSSNGGYAKIRGAEFSYQQQFRFLPGWMQGFGAYMNATYLESEGNYGGTAVLNTGQVTGFVPKSANVGISYIRDKLSLRFQFNHRGTNLNSYNVNPAARVWRVHRSVLDIKTMYKLSKHFDVYLDVTNVLNESEQRIERGDAGRVTSDSKMSPLFFFGTNYRL